MYSISIVCAALVWQCIISLFDCLPVHQTSFGSDIASRFNR